jgi:biopolymer transport protein ExbB/TolQ
VPFVEKMELPPRPHSVRNPKNQFWFVSIWVAVAGVIVPPLFGTLGTVVGMVRAFDTVGISGGSVPERLAQDISLALYTTAVGMGISVLSFVFFVVAIVRFFQTRDSSGAGV